MKPERWDEVDQILQSVLERAPAEREAYLLEVCAGDEQLRREVLTVLASHEQAGSFMASPAFQGSGDIFDDEPKLKQGDLIGLYRITKPIGRGGMGEVYLAEHTAQSREVALKILPQHFLDDGQRVQRFRQEARAVLALNHPNVVTVYDIGESEGIHFISTEFVEGQTLRERMTSVRLTIEEAVDIALQVASALAYAHEKGVIHRDVKPENIMLRPDGYVKVLDFGIAKLTEGKARSGTNDPNEAPTRVKASTTPGMVMGTVHYMSPEQARGLKVDERTDTWSLGCVLYEMLTGRQPFDGETPSDVIATILKHDPAPLTSLLPDTPAELEHIVSKALDKSKDERYQTAKDFLADLRRFKRHYEREADIERSTPPGERAQIAAGVSTGGQQASPTNTGESATSTAVTAHTTSSAEYIVSEFKRHRTGILLTIAALVVVAALGFGVYKFFSRGAADKTVAARDVKITPLPINGILANAGWSSAAISPDGKYVVYVLVTHNEKGEDVESMWEMYRPTGDAKQILPPSKDSYGGLAFADDGDYVYYWDGSDERHQVSLYKISVIGGVPKKLIDNIKRANFAPSPDGKQVALLRYDENGGGSLLVANEDGTGERLLVKREGIKDWIDGSPTWSPDGKSIACFAGTYEGGVHHTLLIVNVAEGTQKEVGTAKWYGAAYVLWLHDGSGLLVAVDDYRTAPTQVWYVSYPDGAARRVTNDLNNYFFTSATADSKTVLAVQEKHPLDIWVTPVGGNSGQAKQVTFTRGDGRNGVAWTPDGRIVFDTVGNSNLWVMKADGTDRRQITSGTDNNFMPSVSPDGRFVAFISLRGGSPHVWRIDMDGSNLKQLTFGPSEESRPSITPDGKWVIFSSFRSTGKLTPWKVSTDGGEPVQLSDKQLQCGNASPDGKLIVCADSSQTQGKWKILLLPIEGGEPVKVIEPPDRFFGFPGWTADGSAITLLHNGGGADNFWKLPLDGSPPKSLTNFTDSSLQSTIFNYAFSPDGKMLTFTRSNSTSDLVLISDFK
ncbi:MAG: eukaryotic-like serine/threonine-protein kinase [Acidobacteriota bacterium]|jgi:serine/threonine protein kinase/Tol biopolymer transport system component|nr:eukaryotic-like serine/threonine-protein kinase [Acidobacteriota bacterium]